MEYFCKLSLNKKNVFNKCYPKYLLIYYIIFEIIFASMKTVSAKILTAEEINNFNMFFFIVSEKYVIEDWYILTRLWKIIDIITVFIPLKNVKI